MQHGVREDPIRGICPLPQDEVTPLALSYTYFCWKRLLYYFETKTPCLNVISKISDSTSTIYIRIMKFIPCTDVHIL